MKFNELKLEKNILKALKEAGYSEPTPIQQQAIPPVLEGRDLMGCAQTGTGKTCAFAVPIIQRLAKSEGRKGTIRALILTPTRELALQIYENVCQYARYMPCSAAVIFGGVSQVPQVEAIERGVDILIATPGRLWDLMGQKIVKLDKAEFFVLDEADRMLDMGFFPDVKRIVKFLPKKRQTLLFSATIPAEIADLAEKMLHEPEHISVTPSAKPADKIEQQLYFVEKQEKRELLPDIIRQSNVHQVLVFTRTKHGADRVARDLNRAGIKTKSIHAAEFFHGTIELCEEGTSLIMLYGEDDTRKLMDRVDNFTHMLADEKGVHVRVNKFDTAEVELPFSDPEFRKIVSPMVTYTITERLSCHLEHVRNHPLTTRRYYHQMNY